jgi:hypothetical protein
VEGAVWSDELLFAASPIDLDICVQNDSKPLVRKGDPLPPEGSTPLRPFLVRLDSLQELDATLKTSSEPQDRPLVVARAHYRNTSDDVLEGTLQVRISAEHGVVASLIVGGATHEQWHVSLV